MAVVARRAAARFNGVKVFSAATERPDGAVDAAAAAWIAAHRELDVVDITIMRSSSGSSHCVSVVIAYWRG